MFPSFGGHLSGLFEGPRESIQFHLTRHHVIDANSFLKGKKS